MTTIKLKDEYYETEVVVNSDDALHIIEAFSNMLITHTFSNQTVIKCLREASDNLYNYCKNVTNG